MRVWQNLAARYQPMTVEENRVWLPELGLGIGLWQGIYQDVERLWLRWYDADGNWISTPTEKAERLAAKLRELGINPEDL